MAMKSFVKKPGETIKTKGEEVQDKAIEFIKGGNVEGLGKMLEEGSKERKFLNRFHTKSGKSSLMVAAEEGRVECIQLLLDNFVNIDLVDRNGMTAFLYAALKGETEIVEMLANGGADIHLTNVPQNENAILLAAKNNHQKTIEYLVSKEIAVDLINSNEETALTTCIKFEYYKAASYLLENNANINVVGRNGNTSLLRTAFDGRVDSTTFILTNGGDVNVKNVNLETPLMLACRHNHLSIIRLLLAHKDMSCVEDRDLSGKTALMISCMLLRVDAVRLLLQYEYRLNQWITSRAEGDEEVGVERVDVNAVDVWGYSALTFTVNACNLNAVWSAQNAIKIFAATAPLAVAATPVAASIAYTPGGSNRNTRVSLNKGSNPPTPVAAAAPKAPKVPLSNLQTVTEVVSLLLASGAHINHMDRCYTTPLMHACLKGLVEVAEVLLNRGADPFLRNIDDKLAVDLLPVEASQSVEKPSVVVPSIGGALVPSSVETNTESNVVANTALATISELHVVIPEMPEFATAAMTPVIHLSKRDVFLQAVERCRHLLVVTNSSVEGVMEKPQWIHVLNAIKPEIVVEEETPDALVE